MIDIEKNSIHIYTHILAILMLSGCNYREDISVNIQNKSSNVVSDVEVDFVSEKARIKSIDTEKNAVFHGSAGKDGVMAVSYFVNSKRYNYELGYVTSGMTRKCLVQIKDSGSSVDCCYGNKCRSS